MKAIASLHMLTRPGLVIVQHPLVVPPPILGRLRLA
jgi:hypothetical protein